jgi:hypothetical protein
VLQDVNGKSAGAHNTRQKREKWENKKKKKR